MWAKLIHIVSGITVGLVIVGVMIVGLLATHLFAPPLDARSAGQGTRAAVNGAISNFVATDVDRSRKGDRLRAALRRSAAGRGAECTDVGGVPAGLMASKTATIGTVGTRSKVRQPLSRCAR